MRQLRRNVFIVAILVWPAHALDWIPGGLAAAAALSAVCLAISYLCYRVLRVRIDAEQVAQLRVMQQREGMSDEELLRYVTRHHPNLYGFSKSLASSVDARETDSLGDQRESQDAVIAVFPWVVWSETDTENARHLSETVFDKDPSALDSDEAGFLLEMVEAGRNQEGGMFMIVAKSIAESLGRTGQVSMDPADHDAYGRRRLPEVAREVGISEDVMAELGWDWPKQD